MLASNLIKIPPKVSDIPKGFSGAPESIVSIITEELVRRGHDVTLFASGNSKTSARLISVTKKDISSLYDINLIDHKEFEHLLISKAYQMASNNEFDIIHSHFDTRSSFYTPFVKIPTIVTLHSPLDDIVKNKILSSNLKSQKYVSISKAQRKALPKLNYIKNIYHGVETEKIPFSEEKDDYLVYVGRLNKEKGADLAVKIAVKSGMKLILLGHSTDDKFYSKNIKPFLNKNIKHFGFVSHEKVLKIVSKSQGLILPLRWEEPFGLVMIESMACGTPVIAFNNGSAPEIIEHGKNGFIVKSNPDNSSSINNFVKYVAKLKNINNQYCRDYIKSKFSLSKMIDSYENAYYHLIKR